ncbi:4484_t:CDS:1, partial [Entrophospora sp. SA101]
GASTGASLIKGMGIGLIIQAAASLLSARISSGWKEKVHKVNCEYEYAPNGDSPNSFNDQGIQRPTDHLELSINKEKNDCYNKFYTQRKNDHLLPD